jgi:hypothetical protein
MLLHGRDQRVAVTDSVGDRAAGLGQQPDETLAEKHGVFGEHHTHAGDGIALVIRLGRPPESSAYLHGCVHVGTSRRLPNVIDRFAQGERSAGN